MFDIVLGFLSPTSTSLPPTMQPTSPSFPTTTNLHAVPMAVTSDAISITTPPDHAEPWQAFHENERYLQEAYQGSIRSNPHHPGMADIAGISQTMAMASPGVHSRPISMYSSDVAAHTFVPQISPEEYGTLPFADGAVSLPAFHRNHTREEPIASYIQGYRDNTSSAIALYEDMSVGQATGIAPRELNLPTGNICSQRTHAYASRSDALANDFDEALYAALVVSPSFAIFQHLLMYWVKTPADSEPMLGTDSDPDSTAQEAAHGDNYCYRQDDLNIRHGEMSFQEQAYMPASSGPYFYEPFQSFGTTNWYAAISTYHRICTLISLSQIFSSLHFPRSDAEQRSFLRKFAMHFMA